MSIYTATIKKMETQLNEWGVQIKLLEAKIKNTASDIKLQRTAELNELHAKQHVATAKLVEMKNASNETWEQAKGTADKIWADIKTGIAKAHANVT